jgi:ferritin-like metal-binding protein YciE
MKHPSEPTYLTENEAEGIHKMFMALLRDIYWAETHVSAMLPEMARKSTRQILRDILSAQKENAEIRARRLEDIFQAMEEEPNGKPCRALTELVRVAKEHMDESAEGTARDAAIIASIQKIGHYAIATYRTMEGYAVSLGEEEVAAVMHELLLKVEDEEASRDENFERHL